MAIVRGVRNKNVGNIEASPWTQSQPGYVGKEPEGRFAVFDSFVNGIAAQYRLLKSYRRNHGLTTLRGIVNRWAPPEDRNDVTAYLAHVQRLTGYGYDEELPDTPDTYRNVAWAMAMHECGPEQLGMHVGDWPFVQAMAVVFPESATPGAIPSQPVEADSAAGTSEPPPAPSTQPPVPSTASPPSPPPAPADAPPGAASSKEPAMPNPFVLAAVPALIKMAGEAAPALIRLLGKNGERAERHAKAVEVLVGAAKTATGQPTVEQTVARLAADPAAREAYQASLLDEMDRIIGMVTRLQEVDEASMDRAAARARNDPWDSMPFLVDRTERVMYAALVMEAAALAGAFYWRVGDAYIGAIAALFVATITAVVEEWRRPRQYRMGSSSGSKASGDAVRAIAEARK